MRWLLALLLLCTSSAHAQDVSRGRQMLSGSVGGSWSNARQPGLYARTPHWAVWLQPSWTYFLRDGVGLGVYGGYRLARESTGIDPHSTSQLPAVEARYVYQPLAHDFSAGVTATLQLFASGRVSVFARPYAGVAIAWREVRVFRGSVVNDLALSVDPAFDVAFHWERRHEVRPQAGIHLPVVYQLTSNLGFGLGPDFHWQRASHGFNSFGLGVSSWIARTF